MRYTIIDTDRRSRIGGDYESTEDATAALEALKAKGKFAGLSLAVSPISEDGEVQGEAEPAKKQSQPSPSAPGANRPKPPSRG